MVLNFGSFTRKLLNGEHFIFECPLFFVNKIFLVCSEDRRMILFGICMDQVVYSCSHTPELGVLICMFYLQITKLALNLLA
jgi:hypothetical protein